MNLPQPVLDYLEREDLGAPRDAQGVGGGCISEARRLTLTRGQTLFLKTHAEPPTGMFPAEAAGLEALRVEGGPRVPRVHLVEEGFILMEDLGDGRRRRGYARDLGRGLAEIHEHHGPCFGFTQDNFCGATPQPNPKTQDGYAFYAEHRFIYQARMARDAGLLSRAEARAVDLLSQRLERLVPAQPPSVVHGDLWSGNAHVTGDGAPALIDPAAYWGWAEADLAMTTMFGAFESDFYEGYVERRPLEPGWRDRFTLYNLYHQLNHLNLFGGGYLGGVRAALRRYGA